MLYEIKRLYSKGTKEEFSTHLGFVEAASEEEALEKMTKKYDPYIGTKQQKDLNLIAVRFK